MRFPSHWLAADRAILDGAALNAFAFIPRQWHNGIRSRASTRDMAERLNYAMGEASVLTPIGGTLLIPEGRWPIEDTLHLQNRVRLAGVGGKWAQEIYLANGANCTMMDLSADTNEAWAIERIHFNGNRANQGADAGTGATNYCGLRLIGRASVAQQAAESAFINVGDPHPVIRDIVVREIAGDGVFFQDIRGMFGSGFTIRQCNRRSWFSKIADSNFVLLDIGPCGLGDNIMHDGNTNVLASKIWGAGVGNNTDGAQRALWDAIKASFGSGANDLSGYPYTVSSSTHGDDYAGCGLLYKSTKSELSLGIQDVDGSGFIANTTSFIATLLLHRPGTVKDQFGLAWDTLSSYVTDPIPTNKRAFYIENANAYDVRVHIANETANAGKPATLVRIRNSGANPDDYHISVTHDHNAFATTEIDFQDFGGTCWVNGVQRMHTRTAAQIGSAADAINTNNKQIGKLVAVSDQSNRILRATGTGATDDWERTSPDDAGAAITPA